MREGREGVEVMEIGCEKEEEEEEEEEETVLELMNRSGLNSIMSLLRVRREGTVW